MPASRMTSSLKQRTKRHLLWQYVRAQARREDIGIAELGRVRTFLDSKFGLRCLELADATQNPAGIFPGLSHMPVYDPASFDWAQQLESAVGDIRAEFLALRQQGKLRPHPQKLADAGSWNTYYLYSNGIRYDSHCEACPKTAAAVEGLPGAGQAGGVYFSVMQAGTHVLPHCGPTNTRIRCHLGLIVPESSVIRVGERRIHWRLDGCIIFDDSYDHEVWNPDAERAVLIVDIWHPDLTETERWALGLISRASGRNRRYRQGIRRKR